MKSERGKKYVNLVDLVESFLNVVFKLDDLDLNSNKYLLAKSASIQLRTSLSKFPITRKRNKRIYMYYN